MKMYYVYFARGYANEEMVAECRTFDAAFARANEEYDMGSRDIEVYDALGVVVYEPTEELLYDEY
jgi:hypothetical protein